MLAASVGFFIWCCHGGCLLEQTPSMSRGPHIHGLGSGCWIKHPASAEDLTFKVWVNLLPCSLFPGRCKASSPQLPAGGFAVFPCSNAPHSIAGNRHPKPQKAFFGMNTSMFLLATVAFATAGRWVAYEKLAGGIWRAAKAAWDPPSVAGCGTPETPGGSGGSSAGITDRLAGP